MLSDSAFLELDQKMREAIETTPGWYLVRKYGQLSFGDHNHVGVVVRAPNGGKGYPARTKVILNIDFNEGDLYVFVRDEDVMGKVEGEIPALPALPAPKET